MSTFQVTALITIALAGAIYVWRGVRRALRAEARFFRALVEQLSRLLEPRGFRLTGDVAQASGLRIATFTSRAAVVDAVWEARVARYLTPPPSIARIRFLDCGHGGASPRAGGRQCTYLRDGYRYHLGCRGVLGRRSLTSA